MREYPRGFGARLWFGVAILALGVVWTLDNLNIMESEPLVRWWPLLPVGYGVTRILGVGTPRRLVVGAIWIGIGSLLLGHSLGYLPWGIWELWPLFWIGLGAMLIWRSLRGPRAGGWVRGWPIAGNLDPKAETGGPPDADVFSCVAVWAGVDRKSTSQALRGGDYTAVMGGGELDLRAARPVPGGAQVELIVVMGGVDVRVPEDWNVVNEITAFMGGVEDSRKLKAATSEHTLVLKGVALMGGVEIKN
jgi:hypothetical protein